MKFNPKSIPTLLLLLWMLWYLGGYKVSKFSKPCPPAAYQTSR